MTFPADFELMKGVALTPDHEHRLTYPYLASPKYDGIRAVVWGGVVYSFNLKPIRNKWVQTVLGNKKLDGLDGELIVGEPFDGAFNRTQSGVSKEAGTPDFRFYVFDDCSCPQRDFNYRLGRAEDRIEDLGWATLVHVTHELIGSQHVLATYEGEQLQAGYEGVMLRAPGSLYKYGRATERENTNWKVKRFTDGEAIVVEIEEGSTNLNTATRDELSRLKRSSAKAGMAPNGLVGTLVCRDVKTKQLIRVSPGRMTAKERKLYFDNPKLLLRKMITYRSFEYGVKDAPRFATFQSIRLPETMSATARAGSAPLRPLAL